MVTIRSCIFILLTGIILSSCSATGVRTAAATSTTQPKIIFTATQVEVTPVPAAGATQSSSPTPDKQGWETPASEVLLMFNPTKSPMPAAKYTETVAMRKFQFDQPEGFRFRDTSYSSLIKNKEKTVMIALELFEHKGKANALGFLSVMVNEKLYSAVDSPVPYQLGAYQGWIINVESELYENGEGQIIMVDIDDSNLFYAIGLGNAHTWETNGKQIFTEVVNSISFPGFE